MSVGVCEGIIGNHKESLVTTLVKCVVGGDYIGSRVVSHASGTPGTTSSWRSHVGVMESWSHGDNYPVVIIIWVRLVRRAERRRLPHAFS